MRFSHILLAHAVGITSAADPLADLPGNHFQTLQQLQFTVHSTVKLEEATENEIEVTALTHTGRMPSLAVLEKKKVNCVDEFFGLPHLDIQSGVSDVIRTSAYEFCGASPSAHIDTSQYDVVQNLACGDRKWMRLDCTFIPKGNVHGKFYASRIGVKKSLGRSALRRGASIVSSLFGDDDQASQGPPPFHTRVPCDIPKAENNLNECSALLKGWAALDYAFESKTAQPKPLVAADSANPVEQGDAKTSEDLKLELASPYAIYIIGGVLGLALIGIAVKMLTGPSGPKQTKKTKHGKSGNHRNDEGAGDHEEPSSPDSREAAEGDALIRKPSKRKSSRAK